MNPFEYAIQPGQGLVFQHDSDLGLIIQKATDSPFSHAAFVWGKPGTPKPVIEAHDLNGVQKTELQDYLDDPSYPRILVVSAPGLDVDKAVAKALSFNGKPYGTGELLEILLYEKLHMTNIPWEKLDGEDHLICSEVCGRAWFAGGVDCKLQFALPTFGLFTPAMIPASTVLRHEYDWRRT